jgi:integrase
VPLLAQARAALATWRDHTRADADLVFPAARARKNGSWCHAKGFDADWRDWAARVGIVLPFKQLRHSCGSHLVQGTWGQPLPLSTVQAWLGHTSITTTERFYARFAPGHLHAAREILDRRDPPPEPPKSPKPTKPRKGR